MKIKIKAKLPVLACCLLLATGLSQNAFAAYDDPNEPDVTDDRDFKSSTVTYASGHITAEISFYDSPHQSGFWFYMSTDNVDYAVRCSGTHFSVHDNTSGSPGPSLYNGKVSIRNNRYHMRMPVSAVGLSAGSEHMIRYWFFWLADAGSAADRWPNAGVFRLKIY